jgi:hypothetical protein
MPLLLLLHWWELPMLLLLLLLLLLRLPTHERPLVHCRSLLLVLLPQACSRRHPLPALPLLLLLLFHWLRLVLLLCLLLLASLLLLLCLLFWLAPGFRQFRQLLRGEAADVGLPPLLRGAAAATATAL